MVVVVVVGGGDGVWTRRRGRVVLHCRGDPWQPFDGAFTKEIGSARVTPQGGCGFGKFTQLFHEKECGDDDVADVSINGSVYYVVQGKESYS